MNFGYTRNIATIFLFCLLILAACKDDAEPSKQEKVTKLLTQNGGQWKPSTATNSITVEGIDVKDELFPGFDMQFTNDPAKQLITSGDSPFWNDATGNHPIWPATDTWSFKDENADVLIRGSDSREITIVSITETELIIQIEWDQTTFDFGRTASLPGVYEFILTKQ